MIYLDNAATSWPKPEQVVKAMEKAIVQFGSNPGRGSHQGTLGIGRIISNTRELIAHLFAIKDPKRIIFTPNATYAINLGIHGILKPGDHVITTSMEHNSVWRPLKYQERRGVELEVVQCNSQGEVNIEDIKTSIKENTKLLITTHASNVTGTVMPIAEIGRLAREKGILYLVDASQTAGILPIDVQQMCIDLLAFPGHKGLLGPQGTGGLYIGPTIDLEPLVQGGTGSHSEMDFQPDALPDRFESGTLNSVGIAGLGAGVQYILDQGMHQLRQKEEALCQKLREGAGQINGLEIYGSKSPGAPVLSLNVGDADSNNVGFILDSAFNIAVRAGLHCAPQAHKTIGTSQQGTVRFSPSSFNTEHEIEKVIQSLSEIAKEL